MKQLTFMVVVFVFVSQGYSQNTNHLWHGIEREIHYKPDKEDFLLVNGKQRFNRALYGGNSGFRAEAGDLPEFALYLPGMGGNLKFGLIRNDISKWLIDADKIETRYRPGSMIYKIKDAILSNGEIIITAIATYEQEALVIKLESKGIPSDVQLVAIYGGATGTRFSREGDIGADPESSFYLKPENCTNNEYRLIKNQFQLFYGSKSLSEEQRYEIQHSTINDTSKLLSTLKQLCGIFPENAHIQLGDANDQIDPLRLFASKPDSSAVVVSRIPFVSPSMFFFIKNGEPPDNLTYQALPKLFLQAEGKRKELVNRIIVHTPDPLINTIGGALSIAADAVWEYPSYMHGAVAWRIRLPGWRGAYLADVLGWHDRARTHFNAYALSQVTEPLAGPVEMDTALHLARHAEKMGTSVFSSGYISRNPGGDKRPHHYDMNLVFVDQLLNHFLWSGDTSFVKTMWPLLKRHFEWEDRNFDTDGDHLYDAYATIWASDALQYSGGAVTHSSAYNYRSYLMASQLAALVGEDGKYYLEKANAILQAMNKKLWMPNKGVYAEYKDLLGNQLLHPAPAIWTIYHAIDSKVPDQFQAYQCLSYINHCIPHIPIRARGLDDTSLYTISTTNWQPYTWSLNNVSLGEVMHTALAYWQGGRPEEAFKLFKGSLVESMYLGGSAGNFQQLSFYDAMRGELYRDFADDIGTSARSLVEGLFGVFIDALHDTIHIRPGFPSHWPHASIKTPDFVYEFERSNSSSRYRVKLLTGKKLNLALRVNAEWDNVQAVLVNGKNIKWRFADAIEKPAILLNVSASNDFKITIKWKGKKPEMPNVVRKDHKIQLATSTASFIKLFDPQKVLVNPVVKRKTLDAEINNTPGPKTFFVQVAQGACTYWFPVSFNVKKPVKQTNLALPGKFDKVDLTNHFNDFITNIFKNQYLSPRPNGPTLQLPTQGIGNWAYPLVMPNISDSGFRQKAGTANEFITREGVPFSTPSNFNSKNILFTSLWDIYPDSAVVHLTGKASHIYLLMAGSTNPMQSRMVNGEIIIKYKDGSEEKLELSNPENWWPIEQDLYDDGYAFTTDAPKPLRVYFKSGEDSRSFSNYTSIRGFTNRAIDGGAGTVLDLPLDATKQLQSLTLKTIANDVVIGLMSVTLSR